MKRKMYLSLLFIFVFTLYNCSSNDNEDIVDLQEKKEVEVIENFNNSGIDIRLRTGKISKKESATSIEYFVEGKNKDGRIISAKLLETTSSDGSYKIEYYNVIEKSSLRAGVDESQYNKVLLTELYSADNKLTSKEYWVEQAGTRWAYYDCINEKYHETLKEVESDWSNDLVCSWFSGPCKTSIAIVSAYDCW